MLRKNTGFRAICCYEEIPRYKRRFRLVCFVNVGMDTTLEYWRRFNEFYSTKVFN